MTGSARIGNFVLVGHRGINKVKRVGAHFAVGDGGFHLGHMASDALAPSRTGFVVGMKLESRGTRTFRGHRGMAIEAELIHGLAELRVVLRPVDIMTTETGDSATVHQALHKVVSLHAVFVGCTIGKMVEAKIAQFVIFQLPEIMEILTDMIAHRPIVLFSFDRAG
jgi:hypothetical protein